MRINFCRDTIEEDSNRKTSMPEADLNNSNFFFDPIFNNQNVLISSKPEEAERSCKGEENFKEPDGDKCEGLLFIVVEL